jgi:branched-chain amino acid transport system substrate-binding protein
MKSGLLTAVAMGAVVLAQPATAQVKIGVLNDQSGVYAEDGGKYSVEAAKIAIEDFGGEVLGQKIELVTADHQNKPDLATSIAHRWYDSDGVDMITELTTSSVALAVQELSKEKKKIDIVVGAATSALTGSACSPYGFHWAFDTHALAVGTGGALVESGGDTWFFLTADYAFGHALERDTAAVVEKNGGKVLGKVRHPFPGTDFSSFLLQAQASKAKIIGLANAGADTINSIKQASEFGITQGGQNLAALLAFITDVHALGLQTAQGLIMTEAWYWDLNDANREFAKKFAPQDKGVHPTMVHAGVYSAVTHYLKAVEALKSDADGKAIVAKMKEMPTDDKLFGKGTVRADGRKIHPMYLFEVKKPGESKGAWDYYKLRATIPADEAFRPLAEGGCPLVKS